MGCSGFSLSTLTAQKRVVEFSQSSETPCQPSANVTWRAGTSNTIVVPARQTVNRFVGPLEGLQIQAQKRTVVRFSEVRFTFQARSKYGPGSSAAGQPSFPAFRN
jgi:hypothetical protein